MAISSFSPVSIAGRLAICGLLACGAALADTYYVDFEGGNDSASGKDPSKAWKHAPGDPNAGGNVAKTLDPGDKVIFKGGVLYRGSIAIPSSGTEADPIVYDGNSEGTFGGGRAIVDGGEVIEGWRKCATREEAGGSPHWEKIYRAEVPAEVLAFPFSLNLYEKDIPGILARSPNIDDPYAVRDLANHYVTDSPAEVGPTSTDVNSRHGALPADFADSGWVSIWIFGNMVAQKKIISVEGSTISYDEVKPHRNAGKYALWNHPCLIDQPGEYAVIPVDGKAVALFWPREGEPAGTSRSVREKGIDLNKASHVQIRHFIVRRHAEKSPDSWADFAGYGIVSDRTAGASEGIVVEDNIVTQNLSLSRRAAISMTRCENLRVAGNSVVENSGNSGIGVFSSRNAVIEKNFIRRNGGTAVRCFTIHDSRISENTVIDNTGVHANGISVYVGSSNVVVEKNNVRKNLFPCTIQASNNITIRQNIFDAGDSLTALALYGTPKNQSQHEPSNITVENNTLISPAKGNAFRVDIDIPGAKFINNITDGGPDPAKRSIEERRGNFYLMSSPAVRNSGEPGAQFPDSPAEVFVNYEAGDFRVKPGSPAEKAGVGCTIPGIAGDASPKDPRAQ